MSNLLYNPGVQSPFDAIRQVRPDGSEFWSARDLMELMGYVEWRKFENAIEKARQTIEANGMPSHAEIGGAAKKVSLGFKLSREISDYHLTRYACYLVAMNGDNRKPEIAAAQSYFAIQTRVAETAPTKPPAELSRKEILLMALEAEERAEQAEAQVKELAPAATAYGHWKQKDDGMTITELNKKLTEVYPGMKLNILRDHMVKREELGRRVTEDRLAGEEKVGYKPRTVMFRNGWAFEYMTPKRNGQLTPAWKYTLAYYEVLVKRFEGKLAAAGQQDMLEVA